MIDPAHLSAFVASRICHDIVSPLSSALPALAMIDEPNDAELRQAAEEVVKNSVEEISARVQFLRYAFGTVGLSDSAADMHDAKKLTEDFVITHKHTIEWDIDTEHLSYSHARLMMNLVMSAVRCLVRRGNITVHIRNDASGMVMNVNGVGALSRDYTETLQGLAGETPEEGWSARNIQPLFAHMIADGLGAKLNGSEPGENHVLLSATGIRAEG